MNGFRPLLLCSLLAASLVADAHQENVEPKAALLQTKNAVLPGAQFKATVKLTMADGLHSYQNPPADEFQIPVSVKVLSGDVKLVKATYPAGKDLKLQGEEKPLKVYEGTISIPVVLKAGKKGGAFTLAVAYQQCTERNCFPPSQVVVKGVLTLAKKTSKGTKG